MNYKARFTPHELLLGGQWTAPMALDGQTDSQQATAQAD
jgi:arginyl-tRNA--protein-N-Asp/Glu arginylyltransferase